MASAAPVTPATPHVPPLGNLVLRPSAPPPVCGLTDAPLRHPPSWAAVKEYSADGARFVVELEEGASVTLGLARSHRRLRNLDTEPLRRYSRNAKVENCRAEPQA